MSRRNEILAIARLDLADILRSRWLLVCIVIYGLLAGIFVLVGLRESSVVGFTGMGRVLFSLCHALVLVLPILALAVTGQVINRARDEGALELLLSQPIRRASYFSAVTLVRVSALILPLAAMLLGLGLFGRIVFAQPIPWSFLARSIALCAALIWAFAALGLCTSVRVRSPARAMTYLIVFWLAGVALLDFGLIALMLQWRVDAQTLFVLAALNPVETVRLALLAAGEPELQTLGPVGFYLSTRLGPSMLLALGLVWPLCFGLIAWGVGLASFRRGDAV